MGDKTYELRRCWRNVKEKLMTDSISNTGAARERRSSRKDINYALVANGRDDVAEQPKETDSMSVRSPIKIKLKLTKSGNRHVLVKPDKTENSGKDENLRKLLNTNPPQESRPSDFELPENFHREVADAENDALRKEIINEIGKLENESLLWMNCALKLTKSEYIKSFGRYYKDLDPNCALNPDASMKLTALTIEMAARNYRLARSNENKTLKASPTVNESEKMVDGEEDIAKLVGELKDSSGGVGENAVPAERRLTGQPPSKTLLRNVHRKTPKVKRSLSTDETCGKRKRRYEYENENELCESVLSDD